MTEKKTDGTDNAVANETGDDGFEERQVLSYAGSTVPRFVALIWLVFFIWGIVYLVRWIPESWMEWFSR